MKQAWNILEKGKVVNTIIANEGFVAKNFTDYELAYEVNNEPEPTIQLDAVIDKLTDDEYERYLDLDYYDPKATKEVKQKSVEVKRAKMKLERGGSLNASEFVETAKVFVQQGVVTQARFDEILKALT